MPASDLIHHFASAVLESGIRHNVAAGLPTRVKSKAWTGNDLVRFMLQVGTELNDAFFGLAGSKCPASSSAFGVELMVLSVTLGEALDRYFRFYEVITDGLSLNLNLEGNVAHIDIVIADPTLDPRRFLTEWYTLRLRGISQWLIQEEIPLVRVEFAHERQLDARVYADVFGEGVLFDQLRNRLTFPSRYLNRRIVRNLADLWMLSSGEFLPESPRRLHRNWSTLLKSTLRAQLHRLAPVPTMEQLAEKFAVSSQTMRRGLKAEGTSYRQIKREVRREVVLSNIADTSLPLSEISMLAGFSEATGLVRAMKTWTGLSPSAYRRATIEGSAGDAPEPVSDPPRRASDEA